MGAVWSSLRWLVTGTIQAPFTFPLQWLRINIDLLSLQAYYAVTTPVRKPFSWLGFQYEVHQVLWGLELHHRLEMSLNNCLGFTGKISPLLPHVDSQAAKRPPKTPMKMSGSMQMKGEGPIVRDLVLVGGGHSHVYVLKKFGMQPIPGVRITLISIQSDTPYSGMLPGHVAGAYTREESHLDLGRLAVFSNTIFIQARVNKIDRFSKLVYLEDTSRPPVPYDVLSIDIGSSPKLFKQSATANEISITAVKPISKFGQVWNNLLESIPTNGKKATRVAVVGAGAGGVELTLSMQQRLLKEGKKVEFILLSGTSTVCPSHNKLAQQKFLRVLKERKVKVMLNFEVVSTNGNLLVSRNGDTVEADESIWCTSAAAQSWLGESGFAVDEAGFVSVNDSLESINTPNVFAAGDIADVVNHPRPKAGVFAVRHGPPLAENLRRALLKEEPLIDFEPQKRFLGIIGTGTNYCIATKGEMAIEGDWLWELKDWIDRKWMAGYSSHLPEMPEPKLPQDHINAAAAAGPHAIAEISKSFMRCGGCGSKVGASILSRVLAQLDVPTRPDIELGLDAPDDCALVQPPPEGHLLVQTIDYFRSFIKDPYVFGQIAVNHALSDCHAMCAEPVSALALCVVPFASEKKVESTLLQIMSGACLALKESNCALVGGHTSEGAELAMGFAVNGIVHRDSVLKKQGAQVGDVIILTKPIGTGTLFAANMKLKAESSWIDAAVSSMLMSNREAALVLRDVGMASSCTDVTGFGLLGHLVEMIKDTGKSAEIDLDSIPFFPGALDCAKAKIFSSLQPQNIRIKRSVMNHEDFKDSPRYHLLFDPQTSGGLLATVPEENVEKTIRMLHSLGFDSSMVIGRIGKQVDPLYSIQLK